MESEWDADFEGSFFFIRPVDLCVGISTEPA